MVGVANTGKLQHVRRADRTRRQDHLAPYDDPLDPTAARILDRDRTCALEHDAVHQRIGDDCKIGALDRRAQIGSRGTLPPPAAAGLLNPADVVPGAGR